MSDTPDLIHTQFVVYLTDRLDPTRTRRIVIEREPGTVTTTTQARAYATEIIGPAWEIGSVLPVADPAEFAHVLDALDELRANAAPRPVTIPATPPVRCPGGIACDC